MTTTKFNFVYAAGDDTRADPTRHRRARLVERLQEQSRLAVDPTATTRTITRNKKGSGPVEIKQVIRPQWRIGGDGKLIFWMKAGGGKVEVAPGKFAIVVDTVKVIPTMVEALIERVSTGEFDSQLASKKKPQAKGLNVPVDVKKLGKAQSGKRKAA
jgi:hypothetical protein